MKRQALVWLSSLLLPLLAMAETSIYDLQKPFGFCTQSSRTADTPYDITGGGCYAYPVEGVAEGEVITLTSNGGDMRSDIEAAIKGHSVIIFDGSEGDFSVSSTISLTSIKNKTLIGINNARLKTTWYATQEIIDALNAAGVPSMSTSSGGGKLSNGTEVKEQAEFNTRQIIIDLTGDTKETYRKSGIFYFKSCQNLIIRNLQFAGPGSIDVGGDDLVSFYGTKNCWVDHCDFADGMDGNFDITQKSDFNTVSWCTFSYTDHSYMHQNTNLVGSSDSEATGYLNTTFAFNHWGDNCRARMPMARVGKIHMLNNYYTCTSGNNCINPRKNSEFLVEGNYFATGVKKIYSQSGATVVTWAASNYVADKSATKPSSLGATVTVPYAYDVADAETVPAEVGTHAGATLFGETGQQTAIRQVATGAPARQERYNLAGQRVGENARGVIITNGKLIVR